VGDQFKLRAPNADFRCEKTLTGVTQASSRHHH